MLIRVIWVGRTKNAAIKSLLADYLERLRHLVPCEVLETRDVSKARGLRGPNLLSAEGAEIARVLPKGGQVVVLNEMGREFSSPELARWLESALNQGLRELSFVIGGSEGLSHDIAAAADLNLSLGRMTWTHEMCRLLLIEQLYRAFSILRSIPYHK